MDKVVIILSLIFTLISCNSKEETSLKKINLKFTYSNSIKVNFNKNLIEIDYVGVKIREKAYFSINEKNSILDSYNSNMISDFEGKEIYLFPDFHVVMPTSSDVIELNSNNKITMFNVNINTKKASKYQSILNFNNRIKEILLNNIEFKNSLKKLDSLEKTIKSLH